MKTAKLMPQKYPVALGWFVEAMPHALSHSSNDDATACSRHLLDGIKSLTPSTQRKFFRACQQAMNLLIPVSEELREKCSPDLIAAGARLERDSCRAVCMLYESLLREYAADSAGQPMNPETISSFRWEFIRGEHRTPLYRLRDGSNGVTNERVGKRIQHVASYLRDAHSRESMDELLDVVSRNLMGKIGERSGTYAFLLKEALLLLLPSGKGTTFDSAEVTALINIEFRSLLAAPSVPPQRRAA